jgi:hypothetical protein
LGPLSYRTPATEGTAASARQSLSSELVRIVTGKGLLSIWLEWYKTLGKVACQLSSVLLFCVILRPSRTFLGASASTYTVARFTL